MVPLEAMNQQEAPLTLFQNWLKSNPTVFTPIDDVLEDKEYLMKNKEDILDLCESHMTYLNKLDSLDFNESLKSLIKKETSQLFEH